MHNYPKAHCLWATTSMLAFIHGDIACIITVAGQFTNYTQAQNHICVECCDWQHMFAVGDTIPG